MKIGIVAQEQDGDSFGVRRDYLNLIHEFGTPVIIYPTDRSEFYGTYSIDGLVLPGGSDVSARRYGHITHPLAYRPNPFLEHFDVEILPTIIKNKIPIFGICRGLQTLNVHFGGTLRQHLWNHPHSTHRRDLVHEVTWPGGKFGVNSFHHQCIWKLGKNLIADAKSSDGIIESIQHETLPIFAVQWHPEEIGDDYSISLMSKLFS